MNYKHLFGPVPSRRLGISLGIDLVPPKTCTYNCIYCECGRTTALTIERKEYVSTDEVITEIDDYLSKSPEIDYITFSGSGEPTLHNGIGRIAAHIKAHFPEYKLALLTNGSLFWDEGVIRDVQDVDVIVPSLDAATREAFLRIDRPCQSLDILKIIKGLVNLREHFNGNIWLEIFVVPGINDNDEEITALNSAIQEIKPDKIQLNTLDRPGVLEWVEAADEESMQRVLAGISHPEISITGKASSRESLGSYSGDILDAILQTIGRRPCTVEDLSQVFGLHQNEINKYLEILIEHKDIHEKRENRGIFFVLS